jgi:hypothetical protein
MEILDVPDVCGAFEAHDHEPGILADAMRWQACAKTKPDPRRAGPGVSCPTAVLDFWIPQRLSSPHDTDGAPTGLSAPPTRPRLVRGEGARGGAAGGTGRGPWRGGVGAPASRGGRYA